MLSPASMEAQKCCFSKVYKDSVWFVLTKDSLQIILVADIAELKRNSDSLFVSFGEIVHHYNVMLIFDIVNQVRSNISSTANNQNFHAKI